MWESVTNRKTTLADVFHDTPRHYLGRLLRPRTLR
jgi:hypothetical protein